LYNQCFNFATNAKKSSSTNEEYNNKGYSKESIYQVLESSNLEPKYESENIRVKYCPLCPKPHNDEMSNLNTMLIRDNFYQCFRCGSKGNVKFLFKKIGKSTNYHKVKDNSGLSGFGSSSESDIAQGYHSKSDFSDISDITDLDESKYFKESKGVLSELSPQEYFEKKKSSEFDNSHSKPLSNDSNVSNESIKKYKSNIENINEKLIIDFDNKLLNSMNSSNSKTKISMDNTYLINTLYRRILNLDDVNCAIVLNYIVNERKLKIETIEHFNVGISYEKFNKGMDNLNLPCVTFPMFYPLGNGSIIANDKDKIDSNIYDFFDCSNFLLTKMKLRAIGKEFKAFQRIEPQNAFLW